MPQVYTIGVLIPIWNDAPSEAPVERPLGRLAMEMETLGVSIVFGHRIHAGALWGWKASGKGWSPVEGVPLDAVYDRFPIMASRATLMRSHPMANATAARSGNPSFPLPHHTTACAIPAD